MGCDSTKRTDAAAALTIGRGSCHGLSTRQSPGCAANLVVEPHGKVSEYELRTGGAPLRVVLHKTSYFDAAERAGFEAALKETPIVSMVTLVPSLFRLLRYGAYPPKVGTVCTVNADRTFLFTSGFMPELGTYPGPHVPQPFEVRCLGPEGRLLQRRMCSILSV